jgi:hypothetical protein
MQLASELQAIGQSPHRMRAMYDAEPMKLPGFPSELDWQPLGGAGIPFSENLPVAAAYAQGEGEKVYVTLQEIADSEEVQGWGYVWESEHVVLHTVSRRSIVTSVRGVSLPHFGPPH